MAFPSFESPPLPSSCALQQQDDVVEREATTSQEGATRLTADDAVSVDETPRESFDLVSSAATSSAAESAAEQMNHLDEYAFSDADFSLADIGTDLLSDIFLDPFAFCDP